MARSRRQRARAADPKPDEDDGGAEYFAAYAEHSKVLRTWLVAYGVGGPVLILSQDRTWEQMSRAGSLQIISILFLAGVFLQVAIAALNKSIMWACYYGELNPEYKQTRRYRFASWLSERYSIDLTIDFISLFAFGIATYICVTSLVQ